MAHGIAEIALERNTLEERAALTTQVRPYPIRPLNTRGQRFRGVGTQRLVPEVGAKMPDLGAAGAHALARMVDLEVGWSWTAIHRGQTPETAGRMGFRAICATRPKAEALLLVPSGAAQALADRILGATWQGSAAPLPRIDDLSQGVLMYALCRVLASLGGGYQALETIAGPEPLAAALVSSGLTPPNHGDSLVVGDGVLMLGGRPVPITLVTTADQLPQPRAGATDLFRFRDLQLPIYACGGLSHLRQANLAHLGEGDVVTFDRCALSLTEAGFGGRADLRLGGTPLRGLWLRCAMETMEVVMEDPETTALGPSEGQRQTDPTSKALALGADAPVTVELELARFTLTLQDLAELRAGDVLRSGRAVGEQVCLRVGQRVVARGDLVDVDGELGVQVTNVVAR